LRKVAKGKHENALYPTPLETTLYWVESTARAQCRGANANYSKKDSKSGWARNSTVSQKKTTGKTAFSSTWRIGQWQLKKKKA